MDNFMTKMFAFTPVKIDTRSKLTKNVLCGWHICSRLQKLNNFTKNFLPTKFCHFYKFTKKT